MKPFNLEVTLHVSQRITKRRNNTLSRIKPTTHLSIPSYDWWCIVRWLGALNFVTLAFTHTEFIFSRACATEIQRKCYADYWNPVKQSAICLRPPSLLSHSPAGATNDVCLAVGAHSLWRDGFSPNIPREEIPGVFPRWTGMRCCSAASKHFK